MSKQTIGSIVMAIGKRHVGGILRLVSKHEMSRREPSRTVYGCVIGKCESRD